MLTIKKNPDTEIFKEITKMVHKNQGYCPCMIEKNNDTICPCKSFREQQVEGECHCGRYIKIDIKKK